MKELTTRQRIAKVLAARPSGMTPSGICKYLYSQDVEIDPDEVIDHIEHLKDTDGIEMMAAPPECRDCGFDGYTDLLNIPSSCPECNGEWIEEPLYKIDGDDDE